MNLSRDYWFYVLFVVLTLIAVVPLVLRQQLPPIHTKSDVWPKLTASKTSCGIDAQHLKMRCSIAYTPQVQAMNNTQINLDGFMLPLESAADSKHYLLSLRSPSCPYCPPGAANEMVEVFAKSPMVWSDQLTSLQGKLTLAERINDTGVFYQLKDAEPAVTENKSSDLAIPPAAVGNAGMHYHFSELKNGSVHETSLAPWMGKPFIALFWRSDCAPCLKELELLPLLALHNSNRPFLLIALGDESYTKVPLPHMPSNVHMLRAEDEAREVLRAFGNDRMIALPYSVMIDASGMPCGKRYGILSADHIQQWRKQCI